MPIISIRDALREDLGLVPKPGDTEHQFPAIVTDAELSMTIYTKPQELVDGVLHRGSKMILGGTSKSNKTWVLMDLAMSVAAGIDWWGHQTAQCNVLYLNFELQAAFLKSRADAIKAAKPALNGIGQRMHWHNLRGHNADLSLIRPAIEQAAAGKDFGLIVLDPIYKVLGNRDENANGEIAQLMNELESLAQSTKAAVVVAHHFAKGNSAAKAASDRLSGAGAWVRDPDSLVVMTPHEEHDCFTVSSILRNHPAIDDYVVRWNFPLMARADDLDPDSLKTPQSDQKKCSDVDFIKVAVGPTSRKTKDIVSEAQNAFGLGDRATRNRLKRLTAAKLLVTTEYGVYRQAVTRENRH